MVYKQATIRPLPPSGVGIGRDETLGVLQSARRISALNPHLQNPKTLSPETLVSAAIELMNKQSITNYFITQKKKPIGIIHLHDILRN